jgi:signal transduction histidine kinase
LVILMAASIATVALLTYQDVKWRYAESLQEYARAQETLARSLALDLSTRLALQAVRQAAQQETAGQPARQPSSAVPGLLTGLTEGLGQIEQPGALAIFVLRPGSTVFEAPDGQTFASDPLWQAVQRGVRTLRMTRPEAARLRLPRRAAVAGLAPLQTAAHDVYWVAAVATIYRARDREDAAGWRMVLAVLVAAAAVLLLGGAALWGQQRALRAHNSLLVEDAHRRRDTELARASRAATIGTLAMGITHELSTPLGIITARAEQLQSKVAGDDRNLRSVRIILEQAERMSQIIRGLLGLARGQSVAATVLTPQAVARGAVSLLQHRFAEAGVRLRFTEPTSPVRLRGEQRLLEHALVNLLQNACDACASGPPSRALVDLSVRVTADRVIFAVVDGGAGISAEAAAHAMEPFFTTKPAGQGTGLGLAIAHEIVKSHRGTLRIAPRAEGGTCAEISLPTLSEDEHAK